MVEFTYNNSVHSAQGMSLYFVETGQDPRIDNTTRSLKESKQVPNYPVVLERVKTLLKHQDVLSEMLQKATEAQQHYASGRAKPYQFLVG
jgi:hypothetical protein